MKVLENPFVIYHYKGPYYFCDREQEISNLLEAFKNNRYVVLSSMRRLGKSGLIHHFHHSLKKKRKTISVYCDVQNTRNDVEFVSKLIASTISSLEKK